MTTAPAISNIADLYRIIDEQPEWGEALRNRLLGAALLAMPGQLAQLTEETRALRAIVETLVETAAEHTVQLAELTAQVKEHTIQLAELTAQVKEHTVQLVELRRISESHAAELVELRRISESHTAELSEHTRQLVELRRISESHAAELAEHTRQLVELRRISESNAAELVELRRISESNAAELTELTAQVKEHTRQLVELRILSDNQTARMGRIEHNSATLKHMYSESEAREKIIPIADSVDLYKPVPVTKEELMAMAWQLKVEKSVRMSFVQADLVFKGWDADGNPAYGAVEISWTADARDTSRAYRNAELIAKATGLPAWPIVAGHLWEEGVNWQGIEWFQIQE